MFNTFNIIGDGNWGEGRAIKECIKSVLFCHFMAAKVIKKEVIAAIFGKNEDFPKKKVKKMW